MGSFACPCIDTRNLGFTSHSKDESGFKICSISLGSADLADIHLLLFRSATHAWAATIPNSAASPSTVQYSTSSSRSPEISLRVRILEKLYRNSTSEVKGWKWQWRLIAPEFCGVWCWVLPVHLPCRMPEHLRMEIYLKLKWLKHCCVWLGCPILYYLHRGIARSSSESMYEDDGAKTVIKVIQADLLQLICYTM